jgi:hypothetical protein
MFLNPRRFSEKIFFPPYARKKWRLYAEKLKPMQKHCCYYFTLKRDLNLQRKKKSGAS